MNKNSPVHNMWIFLQSRHSDHDTLSPVAPCRYWPLYCWHQSRLKPLTQHQGSLFTNHFVAHNLSFISALEIWLLKYTILGQNMMTQLQAWFILYSQRMVNLKLCFSIVKSVIYIPHGKVYKISNIMILWL